MFDPWIGKIPWSKKWQPTPVFFLGNLHTEELGGLHPWGHKELDTTEHVQIHSLEKVFLSQRIGE